VEEYLHESFGKYHARGEWFKIPEDVLASWLGTLEP